MGRKKRNWLSDLEQASVKYGAKIISIENKDKLKRYYPDIPFLKNNLIIKVKSMYIFCDQIKRNLCKGNSVLHQGMNFEFWICDNKQVINKIDISQRIKLMNDIKQYKK